jgi:hypothetical protein
MPSGTLPKPDVSVAAANLHQAGAWLARHGLADTPPTPLLATRLAARRRARRAGNGMLGALMIAAALVYAYHILANSASDRFGWAPPGRTPLLALSGLVVGLLVARLLLDGWVRRVDRRAGAMLTRRAAHPVQPGWRAVLGWPYVAGGAGIFAGAAVLAVGALITGGSTVEYGAVILLIGLAGVAIGTALHLRHLLARPVVAEDEASLTADVIMRVEDARELAAPTAPLALPAILLFGTELGWWGAASLVFVVVGSVLLGIIQRRTPPSATVARRAMGAR